MVYLAVEMTAPGSLGFQERLLKVFVDTKGARVCRTEWPTFFSCSAYAPTRIRLFGLTSLVAGSAEHQRELTKKIGASSAVGVLDHNSVVYVAYATAGRFPLLMNRWVGTYLPAIATAIGRVLLAELDADEIRQRLKASSIEQYTPVTRTSHAELEVLLEKVHQTGYALVDQELEIGLRALGVPVRNRSGVAVAGLSISFLEAQLTTERIIERYLGPLQHAARQITESLPAGP